MLFLSFQLGGEPCAFPARDVVEVVPLVQLRPLVSGPGFISGVFDYRGQVVPVVDLCRLALDRPSRNHLSTRILVVRLATVEGRLVGIIAEGVTDTLDREESDFAEIDLAGELAELAQGKQGLIQRLRLEQLLPEGAQEELAEVAEQTEERAPEPEEDDAGALMDEVIAALESEAAESKTTGKEKPPTTKAKRKPAARKSKRSSPAGKKKKVPAKSKPTPADGEEDVADGD